MYRCRHESSPKQPHRRPDPEHTLGVTVHHVHSINWSFARGPRSGLARQALRFAERQAGRMHEVAVRVVKRNSTKNDDAKSGSKTRIVLWWVFESRPLQHSSQYCSLSALRCRVSLVYVHPPASQPVSQSVSRHRNPKQK